MASSAQTKNLSLFGQDLAQIDEEKQQIMHRKSEVRPIQESDNNNFGELKELPADGVK